jgi:hypothetical protein
MRSPPALSFVHQNPGIFLDLTVAENAAVGAGFPTGPCAVQWVGWSLGLAILVTVFDAAITRAGGDPHSHAAFAYGTATVLGIAAACATGGMLIALLVIRAAPRAGSGSRR